MARTVPTDCPSRFRSPTLPKPIARPVGSYSPSESTRTTTACPTRTRPAWSRSVTASRARRACRVFREFLGPKVRKDPRETRDPRVNRANPEQTVRTEPTARMARTARTDRMVPTETTVPPARTATTAKTEPTARTARMARTARTEPMATSSP